MFVMTQCVMDSYDYAKALGETLPIVAELKKQKGGYMVLRPDSGDPNEAVLMVRVPLMAVIELSVMESLSDMSHVLAA